MIYENIPKDPFILLSFINMKLRDEFDNLAKLCDTLQINYNDLQTKLGSIGYNYNEISNQFI
ncbi:DUF4250 domain-containing protein [Vallitalea okinawensis]|uniref:DUF4250 domain-containing protein n=1 Tax=Vallitalea okinawensis TaxID=2078660 RepID=UPI000CFB63F8